MQCGTGLQDRAVVLAVIDRAGVVEVADGEGTTTTIRRRRMIGGQGRVAIRGVMEALRIRGGGRERGLVLLPEPRRAMRQDGWGIRRVARDGETAGGITEKGARDLRPDRRVSLVRGMRALALARHHGDS